MSTAKPKVHTKIKKAKDLEAHITTQFAAGVELVEIRDYVPSTGVYGRGATFEKRLLPEIAEALSDLSDKIVSPSVADHRSARTSGAKAQIPGQQALDLGANV